MSGWSSDVCSSDLIPLANVVGGLGNGWKVAMSTLSFERGTGFIADQVKQSQEIEELIAAARANGMMKDDRVADQLVQMRAEVAAVRAMTYRNISHVVRTGDRKSTRLNSSH